MHKWRVEFDPKLGVKQHQVAPGFGHPLLAPLVAQVFKALRISATIWEHGDEWLAIHSEPNALLWFEVDHVLGTERDRYNSQHFSRVLRDKKTIRGERAGYSDLFVPILSAGKVVAILVTGPFQIDRPTSAGVLGRWRWLTGRQGHPADPAFAAYLSVTFSTLVLDGDKLRTFEKLLGHLAQLLSGEGRADDIANRAAVLQAKLAKARLVDETWEAVQELVDERSSRAALSLYNETKLHYLGLPRTADSALVGLIASPAASKDLVGEAVRRDSFQRSAVDLARKSGDALAGKVGDHGVVFLCATRGGRHRKKLKLLDLVEQASSLARKEAGLVMHWGGSVAAEPAPLSRTYQEALDAAESALAGGSKVVMAEPGTSHPSHSLRHLRRELARIAAERPAELGARFDRYLEAVAVQCGRRIDPSRGHLDAGFEQMAIPLIGSGVLDEKSFGSLCDVLDRAAGEAFTLDDLFAVYRRAVGDVAEAVKMPVPARQDRSLRRAIDYIDQRYAAPLRLETVARIAGITPVYFSKLFKERENATFEDYVRGLRVERAKQLLVNTGIGVARVAEQSGFNSAQYFCRVFRHQTGMTPLSYRREPVESGPRRRGNTVQYKLVSVQRRPKKSR